MAVWVVCWHDNDADGVVGVYSSLVRAESAADRVNICGDPVTGRGMRGHSIVVMEVDSDIYVYADYVHARDYA